jgi:hypothetical protein
MDVSSANTPTWDVPAAEQAESDYGRRAKRYAAESKLEVMQQVASSQALIARSKANLQSCRIIYP